MLYKKVEIHTDRTVCFNSMLSYDNDNYYNIIMDASRRI